MTQRSKVFTALRHKFAEDLHEILQCMVCCENLSIPIPQCIQGHHVCHNCQPLMSDCPYCKSQFNGTRNYLAETLIGKFEEIKISLIDPHSHVNKKFMASISTQTDTTPQLLKVQGEDKTTNVPLINYKVAPIVVKGKYPCKIRNCFEELGHGRMMPHLRYYHKDELIEKKIINGYSYENSWEFNYQIPNVLERAINIPNMGLFFFNVSIDDSGDLCGNLQIVNARRIAQQFEYLLEVNNGQSSIIYKGQVLRATTKNVIEKSLFVNNSYLTPFVKWNKIITCRLVLNRMFEAKEPLKK